jgi:hypothetical protein
MMFPGFSISQRRSKFLIPKVYKRTEKIKGLSLQPSKELKDFTLTNSGVFSERCKKQVSGPRLQIKALVDKSVGSSSPLHESFDRTKKIDDFCQSFWKPCKRQVKSKNSKRIKSLNITSPVFSLRKDFKVVLVGEHVFPSIVLKS